MEIKRLKKLLIKSKTILLLLFCLFLFELINYSAWAYQANMKHKNWFSEELLEKRKILEVFWQKRIIIYNQKSVDDFKLAIIGNHYPKDPLWQMKIERLFQDAIAKKINFNFFFDSLKDQSFLLIETMNNIEKLIPQEEFKETRPHVTKKNLKSLEEYIQDKHFSSSMTLGTTNAKLITPDFLKNQSHDTFAIHSVGKVFTGVLTLIMIRENIISEKDLLSPVQLDENVKNQLAPAVSEQLQKVTLYQLMTHKAGLGDYLGNYGLAISQGHIPKIQHSEDFLPFVEDNTYPIGKFRYSNAGILLVGLAIKHAYEKKFHVSIDYNDILQKYIINEVEMPSFSPWKPENGKYNLNDPVAPYLVGSPAGGYWVTAEDLAKFGRWLYKKSCSDPAFKKLIERYGQEFYHSDSQTIVHAGGIISSMAFFSVSLKTGAILSFVSNQPPTQASDLKEMILRHMFYKKMIKD